MQQLPENNLDKFNKSCSTFHQESNKIGFAFFWFFYNFLQESAKKDLLLKFPLYAGVPGTFLSFTNRTLDCTKHPRKNKSPAMWPLALGRGCFCQNSASQRRRWPGKRRGSGHELTTHRFEAGNGAGMALASSPSGARRWRPWWRMLRRGSRDSCATRGGLSFYGV
jgi:hypothetical protein